MHCPTAFACVGMGISVILFFPSFFFFVGFEGVGEWGGWCWVEGGRVAQISIFPTIYSYFMESKCLTSIQLDTIKHSITQVTIYACTLGMFLDKQKCVEDHICNSALVHVIVGNCFLNDRVTQFNL